MTREPPLKPPPGPRRSGPSFWQWVAIAVGVLVVVGIAAGGSGGGGKKSAAARPDCGTASPQPSGDTAYAEVAGAPLVHGTVSCARLLALSRAVTRAPGGSLRGTAVYRAQRLGWTLVPDRHIIVDDDKGLAMVFGRPGAQVAIVPEP